MGGILDSNGIGATWVFNRSGGAWSQEGSKLVGEGAEGAFGVGQGVSVSLSADGNTALIGGFRDSNNVGAAWVFSRSGGVWSQQGAKLLGTGYVGNPIFQGYSVSLSGDGNTAIIGGYGDDNQTGAAWVFVRSGTDWIQQGQKLVGTGGVSQTRQGFSVSLSFDGNTALVGAPWDNHDVGAIWIFTRAGGIWTQQGSKVVGTGGAVPSEQGWSASLSADGNTAVVGGGLDNNAVGAVWIFTRSGNAWSQLGNKLVGTGAVGPAYQGQSVSISGNGNTVIAGGFWDSTNTGAAWIYSQTPTIVKEPFGEVPRRFLLEQNYPNPFNPVTTIRYQLPTRVRVTLRVFDMVGKEVARLVNGMEGPGYKTVDFSSYDLASGIYYYRLEAGDWVETRKLVLLR